MQAFVGRSVGVGGGFAPESLSSRLHIVHGPNGGTDHGFLIGIPQSDPSLVQIGKLGEQPFPGLFEFSSDQITGVHSVGGEGMVNDGGLARGFLERGDGLAQRIGTLVAQRVFSVRQKEWIGAVDSLILQFGNPGPHKMVSVFEGLCGGLIDGELQENRVGGIGGIEEHWSGEAGEECLGGIGKDLAAIHCSFL